MGQKLSRGGVNEAWLRPSGMYPTSDVNLKKLRRLILKGKLAPCYPAQEEEPKLNDEALDECPICFQYYPSINRSRCCGKGICTECFLQVKAPVGSSTTYCPFCKSASYAVEYRGPRSASERRQERAEEQRVIEMRIRTEQGPEPPPPEADRPSAPPEGLIVVGGGAPSETETEDLMLQEALALSAREYEEEQQRRRSDGRAGGAESPDGASSIMDEIIAMMGLRDADAQRCGQSDPGSLLDDVVAMMLANGPAAGEEAGARAAEGRHDTRALEAYLLPQEEGQLPEQEVVVGVVLTGGPDPPPHGLWPPAGENQRRIVGGSGGGGSGGGGLDHAEVELEEVLDPRAGRGLPDSLIQDAVRRGDLAVLARLEGDDSRVIQRVRVSDQVEQWSRPHAAASGRFLDDERVEEAVARGDAEARTRTTTDGPRRGAVQDAIDDADARWRAVLEAQDAALRRLYSGGCPS
uniref:Ring u-box domain-containing protein n=1 Tax=Tetraselmis sp. GSL018 TaxID=582737 RepID=A0A061R3V2_9CHLO